MSEKWYFILGIMYVIIYIIGLIKVMSWPKIPARTSFLIFFFLNILVSISYRVAARWDWLGLPIHYIYMGLSVVSFIAVIALISGITQLVGDLRLVYVEENEVL